MKLCKCGPFYFCWWEVSFGMRPDYHMAKPCCWFWFSWWRIESAWARNPPAE